MDVWEAIRGRRSVRRLGGGVSLEELARAIEAATWAPSAHNAQPWRFIVLVSGGVKRRLAEAMGARWVEDLVADGVEREVAEEAARRSIELISSSPAVIVACATMEDMRVYPDERRSRAEHLMAVQSVAAAIQNMLLALHAQGLAACWLCAPLFCQDVVREVLGLPGHVEPQALIVVGRPLERPSPPPRRPISEVAFMDGWGRPLEVGAP